mgnify:CR=1 FL=1
MDIETAANIGEAVSGIAILFTLLFSCLLYTSDAADDP